MRGITAQTTAAPPGHTPSILVVEDEVLIRLAVIDHLQDRGFRVLGVGNAAEAIEALEANLQIDLVFTDVKMPGVMDGLALAQWIRAQRPGLPVIVASGHARRSDSASALDAAVFFPKPYDIDEIADRILQILEVPPGDR
jgi:CheY-like chemotaxis protein